MLPKLTEEMVLNGLKKGVYKKILIFSTPAISSPTGEIDMQVIMRKLFSKQITKFSDVCSLEFFKQQPEVFYDVCHDIVEKSLDKPSYTHHFIRMLYEQGIVSHYLT